MLSQIAKSEIQSFPIGTQNAAACTGFRGLQSPFPKPEPRGPRPVQIVINLVEFYAFHKICLFLHSPTADARRIGWLSCNFSTSNARARCSRDLTVPTGQSSADAASS